MYEAPDKCGIIICRYGICLCMCVFVRFNTGTDKLTNPTNKNIHLFYFGAIEERDGPFYMQNIEAK